MAQISADYFLVSCKNEICGIGGIGGKKCPFFSTGVVAARREHRWQRQHKRHGFDLSTALTDLNSVDENGLCVLGSVHLQSADGGLRGSPKTQVTDPMRCRTRQPVQRPQSGPAWSQRQPSRGRRTPPARWRPAGIPDSRNSRQQDCPAGSVPTSRMRCGLISIRDTASPVGRTVRPSPPPVCLCCW